VRVQRWLESEQISTETSTSNHYEVFFLFRLQSLWNLGTKNFSGLTPPAYDWLATALELTLSLHSLLLWALWTEPTENIVSNVVNVTAYAEVCLPSRCLETSFITTVVPQLLGANDTENIASSIVACSTVFTELLPSNTLIKYVTIISERDNLCHFSSVIYLTTV
jgi:hypothetical protein